MNSWRIHTCDILRENAYDGIRNIDVQNVQQVLWVMLSAYSCCVHYLLANNLKHRENDCYLIQVCSVPQHYFSRSELKREYGVGEVSGSTKYTKYYVSRHNFSETLQEGKFGCMCCRYCIQLFRRLKLNSTKHVNWYLKSPITERAGNEVYINRCTFVKIWPNWSIFYKVLPEELCGGLAIRIHTRRGQFARSTRATIIYVAPPTACTSQLYVWGGKRIQTKGKRILGR